MARMTKPWFREHDGWWYATLRVSGRRTQVKLAKGEQHEEDAYERLRQLERGPKLTILTVRKAFDTFLDWSADNHEPPTVAYYRHFLGDFAGRRHEGRELGALKVSALIPHHVTGWLKGKPWNSTSRNRAISCIKRALNHCVAEGLLSENPLARVKKPRMLRREAMVADVDRAAILAAVPDRAFQLFLFALGQTGARPKEVRTVTAADVRDRVWVLRSKDFKATGKLRHVYLTPAMVELCRELAGRHPTGPLFRNTEGNPWTKDAVVLRLLRLKERLGLDPKVCAYSFRHTWITDALEAGVPVATVSELAGHADTKMVSRVYNHLSERRGHLRAAAEKATGKG